MFNEAFLDHILTQWRTHTSYLVSLGLLIQRFDFIKISEIYKLLNEINCTIFLQSRYKIRFLLFYELSYFPFEPVEFICILFYIISASFPVAMEIRFSTIPITFSIYFILFYFSKNKRKKLFRFLWHSNIVVYLISNITQRFLLFDMHFLLQDSVLMFFYVCWKSFMTWQFWINFIWSNFVSGNMRLSCPSGHWIFFLHSWQRIDLKFNRSLKFC